MTLLLLLSALSVTLLIYGGIVQRWDYCVVAFIILLATVTLFHGFVLLVNTAIKVKKTIKLLEKLKKEES